jgi:glycosyltransferase involved in cell wall biosynthesis
VLVLPSRKLPTWREPVAEVLAEAMAHEVAVIGSDSGVIPEVIGEAGVIVPAGEPHALAEALRRVAATAFRRSLIEAGRGRAMQRFSEDAVAGRTLEFWGQLLS